MLNDIYQGLDPIAFSLGPLVVRWYGLAYVLGFVCAAAIIYFVAKRWKLGMSEDNLLTLMGCAIGGGVLGASLAYQLSLHGREVLLLEQNEICSGTSSGTVAWIGPFDRQPLFMEELAIRSFLRLFLLEHELDRPFEFTVTGSHKPLYTE